MSREDRGVVTSSLGALPELGVGVLYNPSLADFLTGDPGAVDYIEIIPDLFQTDSGLGRRPRFRRLTHACALLDRLAAAYPVVAHNVGLSLGAVDLVDDAYVAQMADWQRRCGFAWQSEHLSYVRLADAGEDRHTALPLPVPYDEDVLDWLVARTRDVQQAIGVPLLLENNVYFAEMPEQEMSEPAFLNALARRSGCGILLDVHNLYCNARNFGFDPAGFLAELDLASVVEVHVAGGSEVEGFWTDSHWGPCPDAVWHLLDETAARAPNLKAITFEFQESWYEELGAAGVLATLERIRAVWERRAAGSARRGPAAARSREAAHVAG